MYHPRLGLGFRVHPESNLGFVDALVLFYDGSPINPSIIPSRHLTGARGLARSACQHPLGTSRGRAGLRVTVVYYGGIYTSSDSGDTWTLTSARMDGYWSSITSSADGTKLAVVDDVDGIYTSRDSGGTWTLTSA
jgi:hypothetical protein